MPALPTYAVTPTLVCPLTVWTAIRGAPVFQEATTLAPGISIASLLRSEARAVTPCIRGCEESNVPSVRFVKLLPTGML
jgi:hypothetical protein